MKTPEHIEQAVATLTATIQEAARTTTTPESTSRQTITIPQEIPDKIREKRKVKAKWQKHRTRENKKHLNKLAKEIKNKIKEHNNNEFTKFIGTLSTHENINYSLWKATKKIRKPIIPVPAIRKADNTWARNNEEQAEELSNRLCNTFTPHIINNSNLKSHTEEDAQTTIITTDKEYTIPKTTAQEVRNIIDKTKNNKAPEIGLINGKILKKLPPKAIRLMTIIFNAILRIQYLPKSWKLAQIKMLSKPGKDPHQTASYRPISLLPVFSKILEKIIYCRIKTIMETKN